MITQIDAWVESLLTKSGNISDQNSLTSQVENISIWSVDLGFATNGGTDGLPSLLATPPINLIAESQSGTGKTVALVLASLWRIDANENSPQVIILWPTDELALQTGEVAQQMAKYEPEIKFRYAIRGENLPRDSKGKQMKITKISISDVGLYECSVRNNDMIVLRKVIAVNIVVEAKFDEKYSLIQVIKGESARLKCNATGDQPLSLVWFKDNIKLDKLEALNYEMFDSVTENGLVSQFVLRSSQRSDGSIYKCEAENEHGKDERTIKLVVIEVPEKPVNMRVKEVWSRTASVVWSPPYSGNFPISKYTIQYWRHKSAPQRLNELSVSSSQTSVLIEDLKPGLTYELSISETMGTPVEVVD